MILNLANADNSDIKYDLINFPDQGRHVTLTNVSIVRGVKSMVIKFRFHTLDDLFLVEQALEQIRNIEPHIDVTLYVAYLLAGRYDRPMSQYDSNDVKIVCRHINALNCRRVYLVEPHSSVSTTLIDHVEVVSPLDDILNQKLASTLEPISFVVPDLGAVKRLQLFLKGKKYHIPIVYSDKHREIETGKITGIDVLNPEALTETVFIFDDLGDGCATFTYLAADLRKRGVKKVILFIPHGVFSKGLDAVLKPNDKGTYVDEVYTTNSYREQPEYEGLTTIKII